MNKGDKLKQFRVAAGLTQAELARRIGTKQPNIAKLETGKREMDGIEAATALKLARALGTTVEELLTD